MGFFDRSRLALSLVLAEGPASVGRRLVDHLDEWRRRRSFPEAAGQSLDVHAPVLNVLSTLPAPRLGGVQVGLLRRLEDEVRRRPVALLYPFGSGYRLETEDRGRRAALALAGPPPPATPALRDEAFEAAIAQATKSVGASTVHIENLAGLAPGSVAALAHAGLRLILTIQDFACFCPRPHLLEHPGLAFCDYCTDPDRCRRCLDHSWRLEAGFLAEYRRLASEALRSARAVVYLSAFLRDRHASLVPGLDPARQHVIAPSSGAVAPSGARRAPSGTLHAAFVGAVRPHKGALVFEDVVRSARSQGREDVRWSAYGGGDPEILRRLRRLGVSVHGYYRAGSLPTLLRRDAVDVALLLSIWPETYTLVVDECLVAGVPVVAFDLGAPAERLRQGNGLLVPAGAGAAGVLRAVTSAGERREALPSSPVPTAARAAEAMQALYDATMHH